MSGENRRLRSLRITNKRSRSGKVPCEDRGAVPGRQFRLK
jgi:hypothetical protein